MTLSVLDTMAIAGFIVLWLFILIIILGIIAGLAKKSKEQKQKDEIYEKVMEAIKTDEDFGRIVRTIRKDIDDE